MLRRLNISAYMIEFMENVKRMAIDIHKTVYHGVVYMLTIRQYIPADQATIEYLHVFALQQVGAYLGRGPWDDDLYAIEEHYLSNHGEFLVGEDDGKIVAMGALLRISPTCAEITRMRVHPDYQGQGYGQHILSELETCARTLGYTTLHLHTSIVQLAAQKLYERNDFHEVGRGMQQNLEIILYEKELNL
jgi:GNAT superfamily N-acetyltransferase